jgi:hypothetical protein
MKLLSVLPMINLPAELTGVSDPDPNLAESWIRIRFQNSQNSPKEQFCRNLMFFRAVCSLWRAEGLSKSLEILYAGLPKILSAFLA